MMHPSVALRLCCALVGTVWCCCSRGAQAQGAEPSAPKHIEVRFEDPQRLELRGELVVQNPQHGMLIQASDGQLVAIPTSTAIAEIVELQEPMKPMQASEIAAKTLTLLPPGSKSITTDHFVICYDTSETYARWNASLYEKMFKGMERFWRDKGLELEPPRFPLVALIFRNKEDYVEYSKRDFQGGENTFGYYTQTTNRLATFDLTGIEGVLPQGARVLREELLGEIFSRPQAERQMKPATKSPSTPVCKHVWVTTRCGSAKDSQRSSNRQIRAAQADGPVPEKSTHTTYSSSDSITGSARPILWSAC